MERPNTGGTASSWLRVASLAHHVHAQMQAWQVCIQSSNLHFSGHMGQRWIQGRLKVVWSMGFILIDADCTRRDSQRKPLGQFGCAGRDRASLRQQSFVRARVIIRRRVGTVSSDIQKVPAKTELFGPWPLRPERCE